MEASNDFAGPTDVALRKPSIAGVAMKFPPNPYTQTEVIRALTVAADPPTMELALPGW